MKFAIILTVLSVCLMQCETKGERKEKAKNSRMTNLYYLYMLNQYYTLYNTCPAPTPKIIDQGIHEISLEKDEALYFDISPRLNATEKYRNFFYFIGVSKDILIANIAMNQLPTSCLSNNNQSRPIVVQTAKDISFSVAYSDAEYNYYQYYFSKIDTYIFTAKALNTAIKFKLKVPEKGTEQRF